MIITGDQGINLLYDHGRSIVQSINKLVAINRRDKWIDWQPMWMTVHIRERNAKHAKNCQTTGH